MSNNSIDGFIIDFSSEIGAGKYSSCYRCSNQKYDIPLCVKTTSPSYFNREIEVVKLLSQNDCNNLVKILHISKQSNYCYFFMEYCQQGDLKNYLQQNYSQKRRLTIKDILSILSQLITGYKQLYDFGIIHRDIKPANILISNKGNYQLADYGMSKVVENPNLVIEQSQVGTPLYSAPQILIDGCYSNKCDVYSLGVIIYELVYQKAPIPEKQFYSFIEALKNTKYQKIKIDPIPQELEGTQSEKEKILKFLNGSLVYEESSRISWEQVFEMFLNNQFQQSTQFQQTGFNFSQFQISHAFIETNMFDINSQQSTQLGTNQELQQQQNQKQFPKSRNRLYKVQQTNQIIHSQNLQNSFHPQNFFNSEPLKKIEDFSPSSIQQQQQPQIKKKKTFILQEYDNLIQKMIEFYSTKQCFVEKLIKNINQIIVKMNNSNQQLDYSLYISSLYLLELFLYGYQYSSISNIYYLIFKRKNIQQLQIQKELSSLDKVFMENQIQLYLKKQSEEENTFGNFLKFQFVQSKLTYRKKLHGFQIYLQESNNSQFEQQINQMNNKDNFHSPKSFYELYKNQFILMNQNFDYDLQSELLDDQTLQHLAFSVKFFQNEEEFQLLTDILQCDQKSLIDISEDKNLMIEKITSFFLKQANKKKLENHLYY